MIHSNRTCDILAGNRKNILVGVMFSKQAQKRFILVKVKT